MLRLLLPLIVFILLSPLLPYLDISISSYFFDFETGNFSQYPFFKFIYHYGIIPALLLTFLAVITFFSSFFSKRLLHYRLASLALMLSLLLGSGLLINSVLKEHWKRPRPKQIVIFNGKEEYRPYYQFSMSQKNQAKKLRSFPSGHASMGFYFFTLAFIARKENWQRLLPFAYFLAISLGLLLSMARIAQGGHFFSDTLVSALIMWYVAHLTTWLIYEKGKGFILRV